MKDELLITPLLNQARKLQSDTEKLPFLKSTISLSIRLKRALASVNGPDLHKPVCVAFLGGTGVGKSSLFNALIGTNEASPTSPTRAFTKYPHAACTQEDFALLSDLRSVNAVHIPFDRSGICLLDTPDIDSAIQANHEVTRKIVQMADIIVYATIADKVSDFKIDQNIREWAAEKRWFFVMNKMDDYQSSQGELRSQFEKRLKDIGFEPDKSCLFMVSAKDPHLGDFHGLESAIYSARTIEKVQILRIDGALGLLDNAVRSDALAPIREKVKRLREAENTLNERVQDAYRDAFKRPEIEEIMRNIVREKTWQKLSGRIGWIMGLVVWIKCRLSASMLVWQSGKLLRSGPSVLSLLLLGITAAGTFWRGVLPLKRISDAISPDSRGRLKEIHKESLRILEDEGFDTVSAIELETNGDLKKTDSEWGNVLRQIPMIGKAAENALQVASKTKFFDSEIMAPLQKAIDDAAQTGAKNSAGFVHRIMANLLPTVILIDLAYRLLMGWLNSNWLPSTFYGMAVTVFLLSLIPGYILLSVAVKNRAKPPSAEEIVKSIKDPSSTALLRSFTTQLNQIVENAENLQRTTIKWRTTLDEELPTDRFGARQTKKDIDMAKDGG